MINLHQISTKWKRFPTDKTNFTAFFIALVDGWT